jgi:hypothetical protein
MSEARGCGVEMEDFVVLSRARKQGAGQGYPLSLSHEQALGARSNSAHQFTFREMFVVWLVAPLPIAVTMML